MRPLVTDIKHIYEDSNLQNDAYMMDKFMNYICMRGLKYDASRHIKRTWVHFVPGKNLDYSKIDPGDLVPMEDAHDWSHVIVDGERHPDLLKEYYKTTLKGSLNQLYLFITNLIFYLLKRHKRREIIITSATTIKSSSQF